MEINKNNMGDVYRAKKCSVETMELKGYELITELFVDNSGLGASDELAYTRSQFEVELERLLNVHGSLVAKITNAGQFQVYIGLFKKVGKSKGMRIANNTLMRYEGDKCIFRLHDTDILIVEDNKKFILDSGGYQTRTTKDRLNRFLPNGINVFQKDYNWYVNVNGDVKDFEDGMVIELK